MVRMRGLHVSAISEILNSPVVGDHPSQLGPGAVGSREKLGPACVKVNASETSGFSLRVPSARLKQLKTQKELEQYDRITQDIPRTQLEAFRLFFSRPAIIFSLASALYIIWLRRSCGPLKLADYLVVLAVALWWVLQEWLIHAKLLHSSFPWWGRDIHMMHHDMPYHHVSIDGFKIVLPTLAFGLILFRALFQVDSLFFTALATYYFMGIAYEWTHFLVHTCVPMRSYAARIIKRAHVKHHLRDDHYWFSFTCPPLDNLMGTTPDLYTVG